MRINTLSVVLATFNEEKNIKDCINSIRRLADEIVVIDGSSTDKTRDIAENLGAKVIKTSNKLMFHKNKQMALEEAKGEWILQLDADERLSVELKNEIRSAINHQPSTIAYYIPRKNYFLGKWLKKGGQYPDYVIRLVKKGKAYFPCKTVHEQIKVKGKTDYLQNSLIHLAYPNLSSYFRKANIYTSETALRWEKEKLPRNFKTAVKFLVLKPIFTFLNLFLRHKGFFDSWQGFLFALFSAFHFPWAFFKYLKSNKDHPLQG